MSTNFSSRQDLNFPCSHHLFLVTLCFCILFLLTGCWDRKQPPHANFIVTTNEPIAGNLVIFTGTSSDPDGGAIQKRYWEFGDGDTDTTTTVVTKHTYSNSGSYNVCLTVTDDEGDKDTECRTIYIAASTTIETVKFEGTVISHIYDPEEDVSCKGVRVEYVYSGELNRDQVCVITKHGTETCKGSVDYVGLDDRVEVYGRKVPGWFVDVCLSNSYYIKEISPPPT